jgi:hypothetical protein
MQPRFLEEIGSAKRQQEGSGTMRRMLQVALAGAGLFVLVL